MSCPHDFEYRHVISQKRHDGATMQHRKCKICKLAEVVPVCKPGEPCESCVDEVNCKCPCEKRVSFNRTSVISRDEKGLMSRLEKRND